MGLAKHNLDLFFRERCAALRCIELRAEERKWWSGLTYRHTHTHTRHPIPTQKTTIRAQRPAWSYAGGASAHFSMRVHRAKLWVHLHIDIDTRTAPNQNAFIYRSCSIHGSMSALPSMFQGLEPHLLGSNLLHQHAIGHPPNGTSSGVNLRGRSTA